MPTNFAFTLFFRRLIRHAILFCVLGLIAPAYSQSAETLEKDLKFCTISYPTTVQEGETVPVTIVLVPEQFPEGGKLAIDLHGFRGTERIAGLWHSPKIAFAAGEALTKEFLVKVPAGKDLTRVSYVVYVLPPDSNDFKDKLAGAEIGTAVTQ